MNLDSLDPDRLESALLKSGALSITLSDAADNPVLEPAPGETPLWKQTCVTALYDASADFSAVRREIMATFAIDTMPPHHIEDLPERIWEREWLSRFGPMQFGERLWVVPGDEFEPPGDAITLRLDPGLAFGTGTHPTTRLCLEWLDALELAGKSVFDFGCGSGILGLAALKLGAASVDAVDIDAQAITATRQNAKRNAIATGLSAGTLLPAAGRRFDVIVANILAGTIAANAAMLADAMHPGARIALSGILASQANAVRDAFGDRLAFGHPVMREEWVMLPATSREV
jgi:ribosomal protein L11 methyltransferase